MPRILIVDDDADLLEITAIMLSRNGFQVETAISSEEAYTKIESFAPQVILLDVFLSGVDGLATCQKIKQQPASSEIPIIIFSGYPRASESIIFDYGADDFISKPFEVPELIQKLHRVLSRQSA